jgi:heptosyltransferase-2
MTRKILIVGPSWVGDTIMAQTLFKLIKQQDSQTQIDVLAPAWTFSLLSRMPEVTQSIEMPLTHGELKLSVRYRLAKQLRKANYDEAIVLPNSFKSALIPWLANIPKRTGWKGEFRYGLLNDVRHLDEKQYPLMIEQYMALGIAPDHSIPKPYPEPEFVVSRESQQETLLKYNPIYRGKPILAIAAGAEFGPSKRWPEEYYAQIAKQKLADGWDIWLFGSPKDRAITEKIMEMTDNRCENIAGRTQLAETIDLLSLTSGVITNDSGLMHMAAALKKPVITIYGSTSPSFTPPLSSQASILKLDLSCQPCFERSCPLEHHRCMRDLPPSQVLSAMSAWSM